MGLARYRLSRRDLRLGSGRVFLQHTKVLFGSVYFFITTFGWIASTVNFKHSSNNIRFRHGARKDIVVGMVVPVLVNYFSPVDSRNRGNYEADIPSVRAHGEHRSSEFEQMPDRDGRISQRGGQQDTLESERLIELLPRLQVTR